MATFFTVTQLWLLIAVTVIQVTARCSLLDFGVTSPCSEAKQVRMAPENPGVYTGEDLTINCSSHVDPRQLVLVVNGRVVTDIPTRILGDDTASFTFTNVNMGINHAILRCGVRNRTWSHCDGCQMINVYEPPLPVVNVSCVVYDWTSSMTCSWNLAHQYKRTPQVALMWRRSGSTCTWTPCPVQHLTSCLWDSEAAGNVTMASVDVAIRVKAGVRQVYSYYKINTRTIVKPGAVTNLQGTTISSRCITVSWRTSDTQHMKMYQVRYHSRWNASQGIVHEEDTDAHKGGTKTVTICGLVPQTAYHISVRVKPGPDPRLEPGCVDGGCPDPAVRQARCLAGTGYWSDDITTAATTYGDVPRVAPVMTDGSYMWRSLDSGYRRVYVYWKPLRDIDTNGPLRGYDVDVTSSSGNKTTHVEHHLARYVTFDFTVLKTDQAYTVTVKARNANGTSTGSTIHIPRLKQVPTPPGIIVTISNVTDTDGRTEVEVTWPEFEAPPGVTSYTLFTCRKEDGNCAYQSPLAWRHIPRGNLSTVYSVAYSPGQFLYGLSVNTGRGSSGFHWQTCVYTRGAELTAAPGNLQVHAGVGTSLLFVRWDSLVCGSGQPQVTTYKLEYCEVEDPLPYKCHVTELSSATTSVDLRGLAEQQVYSVRIQAVTQEGLTGPWSELVQATTNKDTTVAKHAGVVTGITSAVIAFLLTIGLCYRRFKQRFKVPPIEDMKGLQPPEKDPVLLKSEKTNDNNQGMVNTVAWAPETATSPNSQPSTDQSRYQPVTINMDQDTQVVAENISDQIKLSDTDQTSSKTMCISDKNKLKTDQNSNEYYEASLALTKDPMGGHINHAYSDQSENQSSTSSHRTIHSLTAEMLSTSIQNKFSTNTSQKQCVWINMTDMCSAQSIQADKTVSDQGEVLVTDPGKKELHRISAGYVRVRQGSNGECVIDGGVTLM